MIVIGGLISASNQIVRLSEGGSNFFLLAIDFGLCENAFYAAVGKHLRNHLRHATNFNK